MANFITPGVGLFVFALILVLCLLIAGFTNPKYFDSTRTKIFLVCLSGLSIVITFLFYLGLVYNNLALGRLSIINLTANLHKNLTKGLMEPLNQAYQHIPSFVSSLFPLLTQIDKDEEGHHFLKFKLAHKIFSLWQELIIACPLINMEETAFLGLFLQHASSQPLYEIWLTTKFNFNLDTQNFGDLLFKYARNIKTKSVEEYTKAAKLMEKDKALIKILND